MGNNGQLRKTPYLKSHREIVELILTDETAAMLVENIMAQAERVAIEQKQLNRLMMEKVVRGVLEAANKKLDPADQSNSITIHHPVDGVDKISARRKVHRYFDDRSQQARAMIQEFISEYTNSELPEDETLAFFVRMMSNLFFNQRNRKEFKWTPELHNFLTMDDKEIPDPRLVKAKHLLNQALHTEPGKWYFEFWRFSDADGEYKKLEDLL